MRATTAAHRRTERRETSAFGRFPKALVSLRLARRRILDDRNGGVAQPASAIERVEVGRVQDENKRHKNLNGGDRRDDRGADPGGEAKPRKSLLITPAALSPGPGS